ncbi:type I secretion system permease/ATPase [Sphingobium sp. AS12]|uniref:type I secretion system permease/ATPase n=1 Tax=Sphingobium sp. AS12 TaxID=2849495 RepID=UPI001C31E58E|nr:type I secretion system permease/ATPase [Sphingobium sp. AS12]MBV2149744.1 type I secretion system permease/ATPase [Sphingobium sp. AS12]
MRSYEKKLGIQVKMRNSNAAGIVDFAGWNRGCVDMARDVVSEMRKVLLGSKNSVIAVAVLSAIINILMLGGSLYMMLVYDSVLPSQNLASLFGLLALVLFVYIAQGFFDVLRSRLLAGIASSMDGEFTQRVQHIVFNSALRGYLPNNWTLMPMRDLDSIRTFLSSPAPAAFMDLPWIIFFIAILAILHIWLAVVALVGAIVMIALTFYTQRITHKYADGVSKLASTRNWLTEESARHAEVVHALGMEGRLRRRWFSVNRQYLFAQNRLSRASTSMLGISRAFRLFLQSAVLTTGAILVIDGVASGGVIFASSIISARALAPIDQVISHWKSFEASKIAWARLNEMLEKIPVSEAIATQLPAPESDLAVENVAVIPPGAKDPTVQGISFRLRAGDIMCIVGISGSGKSSAIRAIVGAWTVVRGSIRLDGAAYDQWPRHVIGAQIGYLPQSVELISGTVAENISRFADQMHSEAIVAAAKLAGIHEMIVKLPHGYDTRIGSDGSNLSGGQRQRLGLARALYGNPFMVVLDEPNANLDAAGEKALGAAIRAVGERGGIVILSAHRSAMLNNASYLMVIRDGKMEMFGPKDQILPRLRNLGRSIPNQKSDLVHDANAKDEDGRDTERAKTE